MSNLAVITNVNVADFECQEATGKQSLNYAQFINPKGTLKEIKRGNIPYGLFLPKKQAEQIGFSSTTQWAEYTAILGVEEKEIEGYITTSARIVFLHRSAPEIEKKNEQGRFVFEDLAYRNDQLTDAAKEEKEQQGVKKKWRMKTRNLVLLLDQNNQPLHALPLSLPMGKGPGGSIGSALQDFYGQVDAVIAQLTKKPVGTRFSNLVHALCVFDVSFGYHKNGEKAAFVVPQSYKVPTLGEVGISVTKTVRERQVETTTEAFDKLYIGKDTEVGQTIVSLFESFADFPTYTHKKETVQSVSYQEVQPDFDAIPF